MTKTSIIKALPGFLLLVHVSVLYAAFVDFTDSGWSEINGLNDSSGTAITLSTGITLSSLSSDGIMTFNQFDGATGCGNGGGDLGTTGLDCLGDGIGIGDDEITQRTNEGLTVTFASAVNIMSIELLDLFADEVSGEVAVIDGVDFRADSANPFGGGYWIIDSAAGLSLAGITSFTLTGFQDDHFSDYSLARIEYSVVPIPATFWLFGAALIGFIGFSRRTTI